MVRHAVLTAQGFRRRLWDAAAMNPMGARYDQRAATYGRCWAPVLAPAALVLLADVAEAMAMPGARLLDAGTGTGTLAIAAACRFPEARITALDISAGMLARARQAAADLPPDARTRLEFVESAIETAAGRAIPAASFDAVVSSFVVQLAPDRHLALAGMLASLRPGGLAAIVSWAGESKPTRPEAAWVESLGEILDELHLPPPAVPDVPRSGPFSSATAARLELVEAGFAVVTATREHLAHAYDRRGGRALLVEYDHAAELKALPPAACRLVLERLDARLAALPDDAFLLRAPIVRVTGRRPGED